ncbi:hypothetical protein [uncultured Gammaproteobacteria bacterium]|nr:hypothetical protein [uncultured Gammaproteobacteria bacterium]
MNVRNRIDKAIGALLSIQRDDKGIPATSFSSKSGVWTTADVLESILTSKSGFQYPISKVEGLLEFILDSRYKQEELIGSWPLFRNNNKSPSTMATGHALSALLKCSSFFDNHSRKEEINIVIKEGFDWLEKSQNNDGGWGVQPKSSEFGVNSAVISTLYALRAYYSGNKNYRDSNAVRNGIDYLINAQNTNGSWGSRVGQKGDVTNIARSIFAIVKSGCNNSDNAIKKGISFIKINKSQSHGLWDIEADRFDLEDASAQVIYNRNVNCDVLNAFTVTQKEKKLSIEIIDFLLHSQNDNGLWSLSSPKEKIDDIVTWSTAEWVRSVDSSYWTIYSQYEKTLSLPRMCKICCSLSLIILVIYLKDDIIIRWNLLDDIDKNFIQYTVLGTIVLGFIGNLLTDWIKAFFKKNIIWKNLIKKKKNGWN